jgi:hypothetical protein
MQEAASSGSIAARLTHSNCRHQCMHVCVVSRGGVFDAGCCLMYMYRAALKSCICICICLTSFELLTRRPVQQHAGPQHLHISMQRAPLDFLYVCSARMLLSARAVQVIRSTHEQAALMECNKHQLLRLRLP